MQLLKYTQDYWPLLAAAGTATGYALRVWYDFRRLRERVRKLETRLDAHESGTLVELRQIQKSLAKLEGFLEAKFGIPQA